MTVAGEARLAFTLLSGGLLTLAAAMIQARRERYLEHLAVVAPERVRSLQQGGDGGSGLLTDRLAMRRAAQWSLASPGRAALTGGAVGASLGLLLGPLPAVLLAVGGAIGGILAVGMRASSRVSGQEIDISKAVIRITGLQAALLRAGGAVTIESSVEFAVRGRGDALSEAVREALVDARHGIPWEDALVAAVQRLGHQDAAAWVQGVISAKRTGQREELITSLDSQAEAGFGTLANKGEEAAGNLTTRILVAAAVFGLPSLLGIMGGMLLYHAGGGAFFPVGG